MTFLLIMTLGSLFTATWYCVCYYGSLDHLLRFTSFTLFYWPILMSSQINSWRRESTYCLVCS
ncbi:hypothetical protein HOLleu_40882 [Holothuria leucospilota]|uniref:Uncharacterized protein n=1 Tax=Holothuria leucospilota TaxID=206669 RepID=A0A9Q1BD52_HOLLE|nr:hypothetical protein HOLleu_40882 [Holothuria leucospilota]